MHLLQPDVVARGRVALLVPRWTDRDEIETQGVPFRSLTLGAALLEAGCELVFFDQEQDLDREARFDELISALETACAAFVWMNELYPANQCANSEGMAQRIKERLPELPVVIGGEFISICPPEFLDYETKADCFLRGYGEDSALELLEAFAGRRSFADVQGLVWRDGGGRLRWQAPGAPPKLSRASLELFRRLDLAPYVQRGGVFGNDQATLTLAAGRGCTKGCGFCAWSMHRSSLLDAHTIFALMRELRAKFDVRQFHFGELDFFVDRRRALELARLIRAHESDLVWFALGSPIDLRTISDDEWRLLHEGGLRKVEMGSESASAPLLVTIGKRHSPEDIFDISARMLAVGIVPMNNFLFGFPGETREDRKATLLMIERLARMSWVRNHFTYRYYQPVWGTPLGDTALAYEKDRHRRLDTWLTERNQFVHEDARTLPWLSLEDELEVKWLINYELPLATSQVKTVGWRQRFYERLRERARRRLRKGTRSTRVERWLFARVIKRRLDQTYVA